MESTDQIVIDGHRVFCKITCRRAGEYTVAIATALAGNQSGSANLTWRMVATQNFDTREDAERHAHYVLLGICSVGKDGEPVLSVT